jgi:hypothetical protein
MECPPAYERLLQGFPRRSHGAVRNQSLISVGFAIILGVSDFKPESMPNFMWMIHPLGDVARLWADHA